MPREVVLVNYNRIRPPIAPLALEYLAAALEAAGVAWRVLDLCFSEDPSADLQAALASGPPLAVAITFRNTDDCYCATQHSFIPDLRELVLQIRRCTDAPIVLGGCGYSTAPEGILRRTEADYGIVGDGEAPFVALARALEQGDSPSDAAGLVWREGGHVRRNSVGWAPAPQEPLTRDVVDNGRYFREGGQLGIETKRGCPGACVYCADPLGKGAVVRPRPPEAVAEEMLGLARRGLNVFHTCDSEFNSDAAHAEAVCRALIERRAGDALRWYAYCQPSPFTADLAALMAGAGCAGVNFGADSADPDMLSLLGRNHTPADIEAAAAACRANDIPVMFDLLLGAPGETPESVETTLRFMRRLQPTCVGVALGVRIYAQTPLAGALEGVPRGPERGFRGALQDNEDLALPAFYLAPDLGEDPVGLLKDLIGGDQRFFFGWPDDTQADYNYDDNPELEQAIRDGHRGAYWDILRRLRGL